MRKIYFFYSPLIVMESALLDSVDQGFGEDDGNVFRFPADPTQVSEIAERLGNISSKTGFSGMPLAMVQHFQKAIAGIPRSKVAATYIDEPDSVQRLFDDCIVDPGQVRDYVRTLKEFERKARNGKEAFEEFLAMLD